MFREMVVVTLRLPDVPVTVIEAVPGAAVPLTANVNVLVLVVLVGLNEAVTPLGNPEALRVTLPLKPFCGETVMVLAPVAPWRIVSVAGCAESVNVGTGFTVTDTVVLLTRVPEVPVMVTLTVPAGAELLAVSVNVLVLVVLGGLNEAVTPLGRPEALKLTLSVKPFCGKTVMVVVALAPPGVMLKVVGDAERKKLGPEPGQLFTRLAMFTVPMPVEKSQPVLVP